MARPVQYAKYHVTTPIAIVYYQRWNRRLWCQCWRLANQPTKRFVNAAPRKTRWACRPHIHTILHTKQCIRCREFALCRLATLIASRVVVWWIGKLICVRVFCVFSSVDAAGGLNQFQWIGKKGSGGRLRSIYSIYSSWEAERIRLQNADRLLYCYNQ